MTTISAIASLLAQSSTYTYLLGDSQSRAVVLIDPVFEQVRRDPLMGGRFWPVYSNFSWIATVLQRNRLTARRCPQKAACASFHLRPTGSLISMVRKRKPLVVSGEIVQLDAPGLHVFERRGRVEFYWKANPTARKHGYIPRTVRLHYDLSIIAGRLELEHRCGRLAGVGWTT